MYGADEITKVQEEVKGRKDGKVEVQEDCYLIAGMCAHCVDCLTYGYAAVEGQGARKARILTRLGGFHAKPCGTGSESGWHQRLHDLITGISPRKEAFGERQ